MLIRCQRCQAVFSLQDGVAAAGSFTVECGRCLSVFEATAPDRRTLTPPPRTPAPGAAEEKKFFFRGPRDQTPEPEATAGELLRALTPRRGGAGPRPLRKGLRAALWMAAAVALAGLTFGLTHLRLRGASREAQARMASGQQKLLRDDLQSLQEAAALFTEAARMAPGEAEPEGRRGFALLLQAGSHQALGDHAELRFMQEGLAAAKAALEDDPRDVPGLRALALHAALSGAPEKGEKPLEQAATLAPEDPWVAYTRAALILAGTPSRENQDRALSALALARKAEPHLLRAQVEVAAISVERGETSPARVGLTQVLEENPKHERARKLLASLPPAP